jgi:hypothetical protein
MDARADHLFDTTTEGVRPFAERDLMNAYFWPV